MLSTINLVQVPLAVSRPPSYQISGWKPARAMASAQKHAEMGQLGGVAAVGALGLLLYGALGAGAAWVGFSTGAREKGFLSILGYGIGSLGALAALGGTIGAILWVAGVSMASSAIDAEKQRSAEFQQRSTDAFQRMSPAPMPTVPSTPSFPEFPSELP